MPSTAPTPFTTLVEPSVCGINAAKEHQEHADVVRSCGVLVCPSLCQKVSIYLPRTVPLGVTLQDCVPCPVLEDAVIEKEFATLDWAAVGVHEREVPCSVAPAGPVESASVTGVPDESVAAT